LSPNTNKGKSMKRYKQTKRYRQWATWGSVLAIMSIAMVASATPPTAPSGLVPALNGQDSATKNWNVVLNWKDNATDEANYIVQRKGGADADFRDLITLNPDTINYTDSTIPGSSTNVTYTYRVKAKNADGETLSEEKTVSFTSGVSLIGLPGVTPLAPAMPWFPDIPLSSWAEKVQPYESHNSPGGGDGPSSSLSVNAASGVYGHAPGTLLLANSDTSPSASLSLVYHSRSAMLGNSSPGLPMGWFHNYDTRLVTQAGAWNPVTIQYPNGGTDTLTPEVVNGSPTGKFNRIAQSPFVASGVANGTAGQWDSITLTYSDSTRLVFQPDATGATTYRLRKMMDSLGRSTNINYDGANGFRLLGATNSANANMIGLTYDANSITATEFANGAAYRKVVLSVGNEGAGAVLQQISQLVPADAPIYPMDWRYGYQAVNGKPMLCIVGMPSPAGDGTNSFAQVILDVNGRVSTLKDARGYETKC
jgi:hypothetical protein